MKADATAAGQFSLHVIPREMRGVEANLGDLVGARRLDVTEIEWAGYRSDQDIAVLALGTAEVQMRESEDLTVAGVAETGRALIEGLHVRSELHHAKREGCAYECIAAPIHAR